MSVWRVLYLLEVVILVIMDIMYMLCTVWQRKLHVVILVIMDIMYMYFCA